MIDPQRRVAPSHTVRSAANAQRTAVSSELHQSDDPVAVPSRAFAYHLVAVELQDPPSTRGSPLFVQWPGHRHVLTLRIIIFIAL